MEQETQELRRAGLKVTHPRMRILQIFEEDGVRHLTAEDVYKKLLLHHEDIGLATVYRVLTQFEAAGILVKHNFEGGQAVYELDRGQHHDHMIDVDSGKVIEFVSEEIERLQQEIAARHGYVIEDHSLVMYVRPKDRNKTK
jgi:Fur family ferric uptake transcriptional regulator